MTNAFDAISAPKRRGAVAVIVRDEQLLVIRRSRHVPAPGRLCFPGGGIEPNESEEIALMREIREELNVSVRPVRRLWSSITPWGVALAWWLADLPTDAAPVATPAEVESIHWYTIDEMRDLAELLESNHAFLAALARGEFSLGGEP